MICKNGDQLQRSIFSVAFIYIQVYQLDLMSFNLSQIQESQATLILINGNLFFDLFNYPILILELGKRKKKKNLYHQNLEEQERDKINDLAQT